MKVFFQMVRFALFVLILAGCQEQDVPFGANTPLTLQGLWRSDDGFALHLKSDGRYEVCDQGLCSGDVYDERDNDAVILRNFFRLKPAHRFIAEAGAWRECGIFEQSPCGEGSGKKRVFWNDLILYDNVADVDSPRKCGSRECIIIGNVEVAYGTIYKVRSSEEAR